jgi:hypothetical protein
VLSNQEESLRVVAVSQEEKRVELQNREEQVSRRELTVRRDQQVQDDLKAAHDLYKASEENRKKAQELKDSAQMQLDDLSKRELALSDREKTYKQDIELEVMRKFTFGR